MLAISVKSRSSVQLQSTPDHPPAPVAYTERYAELIGRMLPAQEPFSLRRVPEHRAHELAQHLQLLFREFGIHANLAGVVCIRTHEAAQTNESLQGVCGSDYKDLIKSP